MSTPPDGHHRGHIYSRRQLMAIMPQAVLSAVLLQLLPRVSAYSSSFSSSSPTTLPYIPTTILVPSVNSSSIYIFSATASGQVELLVLDVSSTLSAGSSRGIRTLTQEVPFFSNSGNAGIAATFTPTVMPNGSIFVYAGECSSSDSSSAAAWTYTPSEDPSSISKWESSTIALFSTQSGPRYLGGITAFANQVAPTFSNSTLYIYGGMCPTDVSTAASSTISTEVAGSTSIAASNWQSRATYSNQMLKLVPSSDTYTASVVPSKGPPVAEAGFTFTPLLSSQSNHSGAVTQSVINVLLGGHTETAFVNLSTAAIWSLPEEVWSFVSIANPVASSNTELASAQKKSLSMLAAPDSRSGHTAVLSEDGNSLVILGGWVGDVGQAADPQLAVLQMGPDYGQWQWSIPSAQPSGLGIYGHGAALLPGNVMVVYGGYAINASSPSAELVRKRSSPDNNSLNFYNLTDSSWSEEYVNPSYISPSVLPSSPKFTTKSSKIGLGVGLGLSIPLAILVLLLLARSCRRRIRERSRRHEAVRALAQDHQQFLPGHDEMIDTSSSNLWGLGGETGFYTGGHDPYNPGRRSLGFESLRGARSSLVFPTYQSPNLGGFKEPSIPGPAFSSGRKPSRNKNRGLYRPTTINDYESFSAAGAKGGAATVNGNRIHPIYEAEEEGDDFETKKEKQRKNTEETSEGQTGWSASPGSEELTDPFMTPSSQSESNGFLNPVRPFCAGAIGPSTAKPHPFVRNTPSPKAGTSIMCNAHGGMMDDTGNPSAATGFSMPAGQDRDVQEWVSGLEIEDLLFSPPVPGAGAAQTQQRERMLSINANRGLNSRSEASSGGSPTRPGFFDLGAAAAIAGAVAGVAGARGVVEDETRTGSNLSDGSAFSFLSQSTSFRLRQGGVGINAIRADGKAARSDTSSASFNTAQSGLLSLHNDRAALFHGSPHGNETGVTGTASNGRPINSNTSSVGGSIRRGAEFSAGHHLSEPPNTPTIGMHSIPTSYGGAASMIIAGSDSRNRQEDYRTDAFPGSPSKQKGRRTWVSSIMRIFGSSSPAKINTTRDADWDAAKSGMGTGTQQGPNYRDMAHATLLRRKQGRSDWEADELREEENTAVGALRSGGRLASTGIPYDYNRGIGQDTGSCANGTSKSGKIENGRRDGSGKSDDWDVEKAVQNRVVQVMFTMPRGEQLRVVNAEVEQDDEADVGSAIRSIDQQVVHGSDYSMGGLSAPPRPPIQPTSYQSFQSRSPLQATVAATTKTNEQYHALPPPSALVTPLPPAIMERQDKQLQQLNEALAESRRLLSTKAIEPWMLDAHDDTYDFDDVATFGEDDVQDEARTLQINGKPMDLSWRDATNVPQPLNVPVPSRRNGTKEDRESLATAAALARELISGPASTVKAAANSAPLEVPAPVTVSEQPSHILASPSFRPSATNVSSVSLTLVAGMPTTPTKSMSPVRSLVGPYKTPTKTISNESLSTNRSSSIKSRRSGRRGTPARDALLGSPAATEAASTIRKPAGFVLDMVDKFELTG
ncbi:hypothetical protein SEPCBS57363_003897 [Sporothrix epigloea]|uniref:Galactose oxidase/kelch, beta-propeller n=1 Tax=Sporothrix epigloea TaxID=1892477 RepID=A0ABP0DP35_9PEZI